MCVHMCVSSGWGVVEVRRPPVESKEEAHACAGARRGRGVFRCGCGGCWAICLCMCSKPGCGRGGCVCVCIADVW